MTGKSAILIASLMLAPAAFAADAATPAVPAAQPEQVKRYSFNLSDLTLVGIAKIGDEASVTIEMPTASAAGKDASKARRNFRKGARIPGSGYVLKEIGADSITLERDGKTETMKVSNGGGKSADASTGDSRRNSRRGGFFGRGPMGKDAVAEFQKMTPEERKAAKDRLEKLKTFMEAAKGLAAANGEADAGHAKMMASGEAAIGKVSEAYGLVEQLDAAKTAGDAAKEKELADALEANQKAMEAQDAQRRAEFEKMRQEKALERQSRNSGGGEAQPPPGE